MREVEVSRFVRATSAEIRRALSPASIVDYEGSFEVRDVREEGETTVAGARGLEFALRFDGSEARNTPNGERTGSAGESDDALRYEQADTAGPFEAMETRLSVSPENEGSRVTMRSSVSLGLPLPALTDRLAAWKRRDELRRALDALATDVE